MDKEIIALTERHGFEFSTVTYRVELHRIKDCFDKWSYWVIVEKPSSFNDFDFGYDIDKAVDFYRNAAEFANAFDLSPYDCEAYA